MSNDKHTRTTVLSNVPISNSDSGLKNYVDETFIENNVQLNSNYSSQLTTSISTPTLTSEKNRDQRNSTANTLSESLASLYLPQLPQLRQLSSTIMNGLNWINQLEFNASNFLQNILPSNPFRRRGSSLSLRNNIFNATTSLPPSETQDTTNYGLTYNQIKFAQLFNGSAKLKKHDRTELIELSSFGLVELDNVESGVGHEFQVRQNNKNKINCLFILFNFFVFPPIFYKKSVMRMISQRGAIVVESFSALL